MEAKKIDPATINGWGIDADTSDNPNYPIKKYTGDDHNRKNWERPLLQHAFVEILKSTERPYLSAVFGTENPPRGLSGLLRKFAFKYSENMNRHWLTLLLADRIDIVESAVGDILHARFPNLFKELGWGAIGRNKPGMLVQKIMVRIIVLAAIIALIIYLKNKNRLK